MRFYMGEVIDVSNVFKRKARDHVAYRVAKAGNLHDHVLINLMRMNSSRVCKKIAVPLDQFKGFEAKEGDVVRIRETSWTYQPLSAGIVSYTVVSSIEKLAGIVDFSSRKKIYNACLCR